MAKTTSIATEQGAIDITLPTDADLSSSQYVFVKRDATDGKVVIAGANEKTLGILQNAPDGSSADKDAIVRVGGVSKLKLNEGVTFGKFLTPVATTGKAEVCDAANEEYGAIAMSDGDADDIITALIAHGEVTASDA